MAKRRKKALRDAFGRFRKRGAPPAPPPKPPVARSVTGRFLSREDIAAYQREQEQRILEVARMSPDQYAAHRRAELRREEVRREKASRYQRHRARPATYARSNDTDIDNTLIDDGTLPAPTDVIQHDDGSTEYVWNWKGPFALETARAFLYLCETLQKEGRLPADAMGYLAVGNGNGKNSVWIGTRFASPRGIVNHSHTLFTSKSANTEELLALPHQERSPDIWAEVKLITSGRVEHADSKRKAGRRNRKPRQVGRAGKRTRKARKK